MQSGGGGGGGGSAAGGGIFGGVMDTIFAPMNTTTSMMATKKAGEAQKKAAKMAAIVAMRDKAEQLKMFSPWLEAGQGAVNSLWSGIQDAYGLEPKQIAMSEEEYGRTVDPFSPEGIKYRAWKAHGRKTPFEELVPEEKRMKTTYEAPEGFGGPKFEKYQQSPYYNFLLEEGTKARERGAASRGMLSSGAEQKELTKYGENLASMDYDTWLNRWYQSLNPLFNLSGLGQQAAGGSQNAMQAAGQAQQNSIYGYGQAAAAQNLGMGQNIISGTGQFGQGIGSIGSGIGSIFDMFTGGGGGGGQSSYYKGYGGL